MAYQNDYSYLNSTTPFDATYQYIAVYVYTPDASGAQTCRHSTAVDNDQWKEMPE